MTAADLLSAITRCPVVDRCREGERLACSTIVASQTHHVAAFQVPEPSCPSVHLCVAIVDSNGDVATSTDPLGGSTAWTVTSVDAAGGVNDVSCPTVSLCVAVDGSGDVVTGP